MRVKEVAQRNGAGLAERVINGFNLAQLVGQGRHLVLLMQAHQVLLEAFELLGAMLVLRAHLGLVELVVHEVAFVAQEPHAVVEVAHAHAAQHVALKALLAHTLAVPGTILLPGVGQARDAAEVGEDLGRVLGVCDLGATSFDGRPVQALQDCAQLLGH